MTLGTISGSGGTITTGVAGAITLTSTATTNTTYAGTITDGSGSLAFTKRGAGTLTLSGANSYTGGTTINGGGIILGNAYGVGTAGAVTLTSGTLDLNGLSVTLGTISGSGGTITTGVAGAITLTSTAATNTTYAGTITDGSGLLAFTKRGAGTLTLSGVNSYTGGTTIQSGTVWVVGGGSINHGSADLIIGQSNALSGALMLTGGSVTNDFAYLGYGGGSVGSVTVSSGTWTNSSTLSIGFGYSSGTLTVTGGVVRATDAYLGVNAGGVGTATVSGGVWTTTDSLMVGLGGTGTLNVTGGSVVTTDGLIGGDAGSHGTATVSDGTLAITNSLFIGRNAGSTGILNVTGGSVTNSDGALGYNAGSFGTATVSSGTWATSGNLAVGVSGTGILNLNGGLLSVGGTLSPGTYGTINLNSGGTLQIGNGGTDGVLDLATLANNGTLVFNRTDDSIYSGIISGLGSLTKIGEGALTLSGVSSYSGGTTINAGTLITGNASALGVGTATINGGVLNLNGLSTVTNMFLVRGGTLTNGTILSMQLSGSSSGVIDVVLSGTGGLTKTAPDTVVLDADNTYSGDTNVSAGTVQFDTVSTGSTAQSLGTGDTVNIGSGTSSATLEYTGSGGTLDKDIVAVGGGSNTVQNSGGGMLNLAGLLKKDGTVLRLEGGSQGINVTGGIVGSSPNSDLVVANGLTILSTTGSYNGPTFIYEGGTLQLGIDDAIPSDSVVTIGNTIGAGTLSTGTFTNAIGGLLFSGSGGTLSLTPTSRQTSTVQLSSTGLIDLTGGLSALDLGNTPLSAGLYRLISGSTLTGTFGTVTGLDSNYLLRYGMVTAGEIDAQRRADQATTFTMTTGTVTRALVNTTVGVSGTVTNSTEMFGSDLTVSLSSGGLLSATNFSSGTSSVAPQTSTSVWGLIATGASVGTQTWSVINTDTNAITTTSTASGSLQVVDQRTFSITGNPIALGRYLISSTPTTGTASVISDGLYNSTASAVLGSFSISNGLTLSLTSGSAEFYGASSSQTAGYKVTGLASLSGLLSGTFTSNVTAELGSISPVAVDYTANPVDQRVFTPSTPTLALGYVHQGTTLSGPSVGITSTGLNATTASGTLGSFAGGPSEFTLGLTTGSAGFVGATASQTATYSIAGTATTLGSLSGTYISAVTAEFGSIPDVTVAVTGQVYSGQATWKTNGGGNWGTLAGAGVNAFGLNWGANQGSPGLDSNYTNTDTATFGSAVASGTATIRTSGANISLKSIAFDNANASYVLLQSGNSNPIRLAGSGTSASAINAMAGSHTISSNMTLGSAMAVDVSAGAALTINNTISGTSSDYSLTKTGVGTLTMNGDNSYVGDTIVEAGTLRGVGSVAGLLAVRNGATFAVGDEAAFGVFEVGSLTLDMGSTSKLLISGTTAGSDYDQIASAGGPLSYGGVLDLTLSGSYALGTRFSLFEGFGTNFGTLADVTLTTPSDSVYNGLVFTKSIFESTVVWWTQPNSAGQSLKFEEATGALIVVPEPSTIVIASIGVALAGLQRYRRRKSERV